MYHFYSVSGKEAGVNNEMAAITVFLEAYENAPDYDVLNRIICQWRLNEEQTRDSCGLPSVLEEYPGCYIYTRGLFEDNPVSPQTTTGNRNLRATQDRPKPRPRPVSAHDIIMHNHHGLNNESHVTKRIDMDPEDFKSEDDFDWEAFIASQYEQEEARADGRHRELLNYDHVGPWFNYFPLIGCKTEYYYRYSGTQTSKRLSRRALPCVEPVFVLCVCMSSYYHRYSPCLFCRIYSSSLLRSLYPEFQSRLYQQLAYHEGSYPHIQPTA
jgi:hypothetical protein